MPYDDSLFEGEPAMTPREGHGGTSPHSPKSPGSPSPHSPWSPGHYNKWSRWKDTLYNRLKQASIDWQCSPWSDVPDCKDLCASLLAWHPSQRQASAKAALSHKWFET
mmetsp:Transcript_54775/g.111905  ORF Transcript_54775/g.111905 Transcript_54775/m.111905 type:complete len:108 (+) Transcript_54775:1-324(+)